MHAATHTASHPQAPRTVPAAPWRPVAPAPQSSYLALLNALSGDQGRFGRTLALKISLLVSEQCGCHESGALFASAAQGQGLTARDIALARAGQSPRPDEQALLAFVQVLLRADADPSAQDYEDFRQAGWTDDDVAEVFGHLTLNQLTNHFWALDRSRRGADLADLTTGSAVAR